MHQIMQILHNDHINVARLLNLMESVLQEIDAGSLARLDVGYSTMRYMTAYPDLYHHPTEDVVFRKLMSRAADIRPKVEKLVEEHRVIGAAGNDLLQNLKTTIDAASEPPRDLVRHGMDYIRMLRDHMNTEEGEIFPLTKIILSHRDWDCLDEEIAETGDPLFGPLVQQSFRNLARALTHAKL